jgi:hypothetical protein
MPRLSPLAIASLAGGFVGSVLTVSVRSSLSLGANRIRLRRRLLGEGADMHDDPARSSASA